MLMSASRHKQKSASLERRSFIPEICEAGNLLQSSRAVTSSCVPSGAFSESLRELQQHQLKPVQAHPQGTLAPKPTM
jgi:hypothetical protein